MHLFGGTYYFPIGLADFKVRVADAIYYVARETK